MKDIHPEGMFEARVKEVLRIQADGHGRYYMIIRVKTFHGKLFVTIRGPLPTLELLGVTLAKTRNQRVVVTIMHHVNMRDSSNDATYVSASLVGVPFE